MIDDVTSAQTSYSPDTVAQCVPVMTWPMIIDCHDILNCRFVSSVSHLVVDKAQITSTVRNVECELWQVVVVWSSLLDELLVEYVAADVFSNLSTGAGCHL